MCKNKTHKPDFSCIYRVEYQTQARPVHVKFSVVSNPSSAHQLAMFSALREPIMKMVREGSVTAGGSNESINCSRTDQSQLVSLYLASKKVLPSSHPSKSQHHLKPRIWNQHRVLCSFRNLPQPGRQIHPQVNSTLV